MEGGIIYGDDAPAELTNIVKGAGAVIMRQYMSTTSAGYGTFEPAPGNPGKEIFAENGSFPQSIESTTRVVNGELK